jgi:polyhydroxyalkanoate synthesis regulator phasin
MRINEYQRYIKLFKNIWDSAVRSDVRREVISELINSGEYNDEQAETEVDWLIEQAAK